MGDAGATGLGQAVHLLQFAHALRPRQGADPHAAHDFPVRRLRHPVPGAGAAHFRLFFSFTVSGQKRRRMIRMVIT